MGGTLALTTGLRTSTVPLSLSAIFRFIWARMIKRRSFCPFLSQHSNSCLSKTIKDVSMVCTTPGYLFLTLHLYWVTEPLPNCLGLNHFTTISPLKSFASSSVRKESCLFSLFLTSPSLSGVCVVLPSPQFNLRYRRLCHLYISSI